jgi:outer membrane protein assembly factor BamA
VTAAVAMWPEGAQAGDPLNSNDRTSSSGNSALPSKAADGRTHTDVNLLPVFGGTSDIGFGVGEFGSILREKKGYDPYLWNLESEGLVTFKLDGGRVQVPYQDLSVKLTVPRFLGAPVRLELKPSYTWESTLEYDGIGNASSDALPAGAADGYRWYGRLHPAIDARLRWRIVDHIAGSIGARYTQSWIQVNAASRLADDMRSASDEVRRFLGSAAPHAVALFDYGIQWDDRDSEASTHRGSMHEALVKLSPGGAGMLPYRYGQGTLSSRIFIPLGARVTVALRGVLDVFFGDPPFYELSKYDDTYALGGLNGVRGIPAQRYYGKVKALGNVELRSDIASFRALGKRLVFGAAAFFDVGRLWADLTPHPELDGTGVGLKYGTGGGLRLQSGDAFVLRADVAWSPDARPLSGYFAAGQLF